MLADIQDWVLSLFKVEVIGRGLIYIYISVTLPDPFEYIFFIIFVIVNCIGSNGFKPTYSISESVILT